MDFPPFPRSPSDVEEEPDPHGEDVMDVTSTPGIDEDDQDVAPSNPVEPPMNPAELSPQDHPSEDLDELKDYERRMEEYRQRYEEDLRRHFPQLSNDDEEDDEDDEDDPLDPFTQSLLSAWDDKTDIIDSEVQDPDELKGPTPLPQQIETDELYMDDYIETDWQQAYMPGTLMVLIPHKPANPHGYPAYPTPANVNTADWGYREWLLARSRSEHALHHRPTPYTPMTEKQRRDQGLHPPWLTEVIPPRYTEGSVTLKLVKLLSGGPWSGPVVYLCEVADGRFHASRPSGIPERVVAKFQDPMFFQASPPPDQPFYNEFARANINLSREAGAYEQLKKRFHHGAIDQPVNWRGLSHIAPRYYGTFIAEVKTTNPALFGKNRGNRRFLIRNVGVILLEHIDGASISSLCDRQGPDGALVPRYHNAPSNDFGQLDMSRTGRLDMLKVFMDGFVRQLFVGVYQEEAISPDHILVAPAKYGRTRVAMIHYRDSLVDCKCEKPQRTYDDYPHPPHPYTIFKDAVHLNALEGWFPSNWMDKDNNELEEWLIKTFDDDAFGPYHPLKIRPRSVPADLA